MKDESGKMKACASERKPSSKPAVLVSVLCTLSGTHKGCPYCICTLLASPKLLLLGIVKVNFPFALAYSQLSLYYVLFYCKLFSRFCGKLLVYNSKKEYFCNLFD